MQLALGRIWPTKSASRAEADFDRVFKILRLGQSMKRQQPLGRLKTCRNSFNMISVCAVGFFGGPGKALKA